MNIQNLSESPLYSLGVVGIFLAVIMFILSFSIGVNRTGGWLTFLAALGSSVTLGIESLYSSLMGWSNFRFLPSLALLIIFAFTLFLTFLDSFNSQKFFKLSCSLWSFSDFLQGLSLSTTFRKIMEAATRNQ
jgi:hypothetical protein